ncbi:M20/M25/M40 family metallo-hydrolase [Caenimonas sp. DR4.4]|uniref:M20/M25/M40 family metallo-hydrolase n=1 Tax=Caenimonas aquaedulcis TaxID=2793270 RepID=A0A931H5B6_9BURK|nr:M20/M25/M40 family metallo-hydrolase [Caenimonas aquaedulcis]
MAGAAHAQLSDTEQRIVAAVKQRTPQALELLEKAVRINSGTLNAEGVREVGRVFRAEFDALGFKTRWAEMPPEMKRGGHLIASHDGGQGKRVMLMGHMDTVFEKDSAVALWERRGDRVRGQGVNDMKGGDVIVIEALRALKAVGALDTARIEVIFTGDEERTGSPREIGRADLIAMAKRSDYALSFEGAARQGGMGYASISRRSSGGWTLHVKGKPGHSAGVFTPGAGYGAIYEGTRILNAFRDQLIEPSLTFNVGVVLGGTDVAYSDDTASGTAFGKTNVIARDFQARGDLRYLTPEQGERVKRRMREIVAASLPGTSATLSFRDGYPPMPPTEAGARLIEAYSKTSADAGLGPIGTLDPSMRGAGDVQFAAPYTTGIDGLGASGNGSHTDDEDLEIASIERGAIRAALFIYRLTRP